MKPKAEKETKAALKQPSQAAKPEAPSKEEVEHEKRMQAFIQAKDFAGAEKCEQEWVEAQAAKRDVGASSSDANVEKEKHEKTLQELLNNRNYAAAAALEESFNQRNCAAAAAFAEYDSRLQELIEKRDFKAADALQQKWSQAQAEKPSFQAAAGKKDGEITSTIADILDTTRVLPSKVQLERVQILSVSKTSSTVVKGKGKSAGKGKGKLPGKGKAPGKAEAALQDTKVSNPPRQMDRMEP